MLARNSQSSSEAASSAAAAETVEMPADEAYALPPLPTGRDSSDLVTPSDVATGEAKVDKYPYTPTPISFANVEKAADDFAGIMQRSGISGARRYSEKCHQSQQDEPSWDGLDYCAAFDYAADALDRGFSSYINSRRNSYFSFQVENQADYYVGHKYDTLSRLPRIREAAQSALIDAMPAPEEGSAQESPGTPSADADVG